ncbi:MAG TPA: hypothetical protein VMB73_34480 [Acetobacteraceae bacterium]|nr:hypothetical protein [Acetobacteraceae bacterium]
MARKPPPSYANMTLAPAAAPTEVPPSAEAHPAAALLRRGEGGRTLKEASAHLMLYVHPDAAKALKRYAVDQNAKVHDLLLEAVEDWFRRHGLREPVRAETGRARSAGEGA